MQDRIALIRSIHINMKAQRKVAENDAAQDADSIVDPDNVGEEYFSKAENALAKAEKLCDDDAEGWEEYTSISRLFDRPEQFEKEFRKR